jgi:hypothetical protein
MRATEDAKRKRITRESTVANCLVGRRRISSVAPRVLSLVSVLWASAVVAAPTLDSKILFARGTGVPRAVQEFAWRVIETRCNYQAYEREHRSFWAYYAQAVRVSEGVVYSIHITSDLAWKKTEPPAFIEMTVIEDGHIRLAALKSRFVVCVA